MKITLISCFLGIIPWADLVYAGKVKPLWTPEDALTRPIVYTNDISSEGQYSLLTVFQFSLKANQVNQLSQCLLVNNKTLAKEVIGTLEQGCRDPQFIGEGNKFSYFLKGEGNGFVFIAQDRASGQKTEMQRLNSTPQSYRFAPDGKSFVYMTAAKSHHNPNNPRIIAGEEGLEENAAILYLQRLDENLKSTGKPQLLTPPPLMMHDGYSSYSWSPDSQKLAFTTSKAIWKSDPQMSVYLADIKNKTINLIVKEPNILQHLIFSPNGQRLAAIKTFQRGEQSVSIPLRKEHQVLQFIDLKTKQTEDVSIENLWDVVGWQENESKLIIVKREGTKQELYSFDIKTKNIASMEVQHVTKVDNVTLSQNRKYMVFTGENLHHPEEAYVANVNPFIPKKISSINEKIDLSGIQAHSLKWISFDGQEIEGILIYPQGYKKGHKVPLIVFVHGGPADSSLEGFIGNPLGVYSPGVAASLGYATLIVNYRGSLGYGRKFWNSNYQDIGGGELKDIMSGVDHLISQKIADPDRLFITGVSYGGFLSAWAVSQTHRFRASVVDAGTTDWISDMGTSDNPALIEYVFGGYYWDNYELWRNSSPLSYVANVKTPTLFIHGENDHRVRQTQAQQFYYALKEQKIPTRLVSYKGLGHTLSNPTALIDAMNETMDWFKKYGEWRIKNK